MRRTSEAFSVMKTPFPTPGCSSESSQEGSPRSLRGDCWAVAISLALGEMVRAPHKKKSRTNPVWWRRAVIPWVVCVFFFFLFYPSNNLILFSDLSSTARPSPTRSIYAI